MKGPDVLGQWIFSAGIPFIVQQFLNLIVGGGIIFIHGFIILDSRWRHLDGQEFGLPMRRLCSLLIVLPKLDFFMLWRQSRPGSLSLGLSSITTHSNSIKGTRLTHIHLVTMVWPSNTGLPSPTSSHSCTRGRKRRRAPLGDLSWRWPQRPPPRPSTTTWYVCGRPAGLRTPTWMRRLQHNILMSKKKKPCRRRWRRCWACEVTTEAGAAQLCCAFIRGARRSRLVFVPH